MKNYILFLIISMCFISSLLAENSSLKPDIDAYRKKIAPLLNKFCYDCHNEKKHKGDIRLDNIDPDIINGEHSGKWEDIWQQFNTGEMPPEDEPQPTSEQRLLISSWLDMEFKKAQKKGRATKPSTIRRLTRYELENSLNDILKGVKTKALLSVLPEESENPHTGFKNDQRYLKISGSRLEVYFDAISQVTEMIKKLIDTSNPVSHSLDISQVEFPKEKTIHGTLKRLNGRETNAYILTNTGKNRYITSSGKGITLNKQGLLNLNVKIKDGGKYRISIKAAALSSEMDTQVYLTYINKGAKTTNSFDNSGQLRLGSLRKSKNSKTKINEHVIEGNFESLPLLLRETASSKNFFITLLTRASPIYIESIIIESVPVDLEKEILNISINNDKSKNVKEVITYFLTKAFRRVPTNQELEKYFTIFKNYAREQPQNFALMSTFEQILCSHKFLYLGVPGEGLSEKQKDCFQLAEKLAYFLWSSIPDDNLLELARKGTLSNPSVLRNTIRRMLANDKARRFVENFTDQWLQTQNLFNIAVDQVYYKGFQGKLKSLMREETIESINSVFRKGDSALDLLSANHIFVNKQLAEHYKIKGKIPAGKFSKVQVPPDGKRGGLLTQGTFLVANSDGTDSHAILRGVSLAKILLNDPPPEPPKNVAPLADLEETTPNFNKMTLNQKLILHRSNDACKSCHLKIDPWGVPFENYDATGAWREKVLVISKEELNQQEEQIEEPKKKKKMTSAEIKAARLAEKEAKIAAEKAKLKAATSYLKIERKSTLVGGEKLDGISDLKKYLMNNKKEQFSQGLVEKILSYAIWREVDHLDRDLVKKLNDKFIKSNFKVGPLIEEIILSQTFHKSISKKVIR